MAAQLVLAPESEEMAWTIVVTTPRLNDDYKCLQLTSPHFFCRYSTTNKR
jgi:hypothetical protein